jgi:hypothetical protein
MKKFRPLLLLILTTGIITISSSVAHSQVKCSLLDVSNGSGSAHAFNAGYFRGLSGMGFYSIYIASKGA